MFKEVSNKNDFPEMEEEILQRWENEDIFNKGSSISETIDRPYAS